MKRSKLNKNLMCLGLGVILWHGLSEGVFAVLSSPVFGMKANCIAVAERDANLCRGLDCKGVLNNDRKLCGSGDCRAIVDGEPRLCLTKDCRAYIAGDADQCDSRACKAAINKSKKDCP